MTSRDRIMSFPCPDILRQKLRLSAAEERISSSEKLRKILWGYFGLEVQEERPRRSRREMVR
jgi:hypothetical protein